MYCGGGGAGGTQKGTSACVRRAPLLCFWGLFTVCEEAQSTLTLMTDKSAFVCLSESNPFFLFMATLESLDGQNVQFLPPRRKAATLIQRILSPKGVTANLDAHRLEILTRLLNEASRPFVFCTVRAAHAPWRLPALPGDAQRKKGRVKQTKLKYRPRARLLMKYYKH